MAGIASTIKTSPTAAEASSSAATAMTTTATEEAILKSLDLEVVW